MRRLILRCLQLLRLTLVLVLLLAVMVVWMAGGIQSPRSFEAAPYRLDGVETSTEIPAPGGTDANAASTLRVLVWNIAWGYGEGSAGGGARKPATHFEQSMARLGEVVAASGADVVLLQEVDFDATRSGRTDQAEAIARAAGLPYIARAVSWRANWIPFPYWPPSEHFGRMNSGGAVLSRYPLTSNRVTLLPKPKANAFHYNLFYLFRYLQEVAVEHPAGRIDVANVHLEAFDVTNRMRQARQLARDLQVTPATVLAGDFNTVPPEAARKAGFVDEPEISFEGDDTLTRVRAIDGLSEVFPPDTYRADPDALYTFPAGTPSRKLDHALVGGALSVEMARVVHEAGEVSDHLPLFIVVTVASPP
jgi:endonuclease/exonuclease/phosphatase family metal-dependent hydrolase